MIAGKIKFFVIYAAVTGLFFVTRSTETNLHPEFATWQTQTESLKTLRERYKLHFPVGTAIYYQILSKAPERLNFIKTQYASITMEDEMKPQAIQPREHAFYFSKADSLVNFAMDNGMKVRGHCLVWFYTMPEWFFLEKGKEVSKHTLRRRLENHITTVMKRYKGKVYCWDVINEVVSNEKGRTFSRYDKLYKILGEEYIELSFLTARKIDPTAKLYYNDNYTNEEKRDKIFGLLKRLKAKGIPIDGIGIQGHWGINSFTEEGLRRDIELFKSIGLEVQFTEVDISIFERNDRKYRVDSRSFNSELEQRQARQYEILFRISREEPQVKGITLWGAADWPNFLTRELKADGHPYLFTREMKPKAAFRAVMNF